MQSGCCSRPRGRTGWSWRPSIPMMRGAGGLPQRLRARSCATASARKRTYAPWRVSGVGLTAWGNPRNEETKQMRAEIEHGRRGGKAQCRLVGVRGEGSAAAVHSGGRGDVVLIAGKGHEDYQVIGNKTVPF